MSQIHRFWYWLWSVPEGERSVLDALRWWESRRLAYNLIVGIGAVVSLPIFFLAINATGVLKPGEDAVEPLALFLAPIALNICYCAGWISECILRTFWPRKKRSLGPLLVKLGLGFSSFVVAFPAVFWGAYRFLQLGHLIR